MIASARARVEQYLAELREADAEARRRSAQRLQEAKRCRLIWFAAGAAVAAAWHLAIGLGGSDAVQAAIAASACLALVALILALR